jgi:hypothetical protein
VRPPARVAALAGKTRGGPYDTVDAQRWDVGLRFEWTLFERKAVREVWKACNDTKVAIARQQAGAALLAASEKNWTATLSS